MARSTFGPREQIGNAFPGATFDVAQHPVAGVAKVGARIVRNVLDGTMTPHEAAYFKPTKGELRRQISVTAASHLLAGVKGIPRGNLKNSVPFAFEGLVLGGLAQVGALFAEGEEGVILPKIGIPTEQELRQYEGLLSNSVEAEKFGNALGQIAGLLANPMSPAQGKIDTYHANLTRVSTEYAGRPVPDRVRELDTVRADFGVEIKEDLLMVVPHDIGEVTAKTLVGNVLRNAPTDELAGYYFAPPQAPQA
jgi:hypothetical protein